MGNSQTKNAECEKLAKRLPMGKRKEAEDTFQRICKGRQSFGLQDYCSTSSIEDKGIKEIIFRKWCTEQMDQIDWHAYLVQCLKYENSPDKCALDIFDPRENTFLHLLESILVPSIVDKQEPYNLLAAVQETLDLISRQEVFMTNPLSVEQALKKLMPSIHHMLCMAVNPLKIYSTYIQAPTLHFLAGLEQSSILTREQAWFLCNSKVLPDKEWYQIYNSDKQGKAWATLMSAIIGRSNTLFLVKGADASIFGAFAPCVWMKSARFYGKEDGYGSAIFSLSPSARVYAASGYNSNFQYCGSGCTSGINPNGVGLGGQVKHFGFFIDSSLDVGHSYPSATFNNTPISRSNSFEIDIVEVWAGPESLDEIGREKKKGVLNNSKYQADKKILEFAGMYHENPRSR